MTPTDTGTCSLCPVLPRSSSPSQLAPESSESLGGLPRTALRGGDVWLEMERRESNTTVGMSQGNGLSQRRGWGRGCRPRLPTGQWFPFSQLSGFTLTGRRVLVSLTEVVSAWGLWACCHLSSWACVAHGNRHRGPTDLAWREGDLSNPLIKLTPDWIEILVLIWDS